MGLMIDEIQNRLQKLCVYPLPDQPTWSANDKTFILKICMAGAFGSSHFFMPIEHDQNFEREAFKAVDNYDPLGTIIFRNMDQYYYY